MIIIAIFKIIKTVLIIIAFFVYILAMYAIFKTGDMTTFVDVLRIFQMVLSILIGGMPIDV